MPLYPNVSYIYRNNGNLTFTNMSKDWGLNKRSYSNGATYADLDNDGDLDLIMTGANNSLFSSYTFVLRIMVWEYIKLTLLRI
jgi:hypothetical protein